MHDTEDCPTQAMPIIDDHPEETHTKSHAKRGAVREYCDNCEMFGHSSENCDAGETYWKELVDECLGPLLEHVYKSACVNPSKWLLIYLRMWLILIYNLLVF